MEEDAVNNRWLVGGGRNVAWDLWALDEHGNAPDRIWEPNGIMIIQDTASQLVLLHSLSKSMIETKSRPVRKHGVYIA